MEISDRDRRKIRFLIESQLEAFQGDDAATALALASSKIQAQFRDPKRFMQMVKTGYPAVDKPRSVIFEEAVFVQGMTTQPVLLLSPNGTAIRAVYLMKRELMDVISFR